VHGAATTAHRFLAVAALPVREFPGIYCSFGGQTALNVGVELKDEFAGLGVQVRPLPLPPAFPCAAKVETRLTPTVAYWVGALVR